MSGTPAPFSRSHRRSRRPSGDRRPRVIMAYTAALGLAIAIPGVVALVYGSTGPDGPQPIAAVPADDPGRGLTYTGLQPAPKGDPCVGGYQVTTPGECTHGPDAPPPGLDFTRDPEPVAPAAGSPVLPDRDPVAGPSDDSVRAGAGGYVLAPDAPTGAAAFNLVNGVACEGDGTSGRRVQVLYLRGAGTASRFSQYAESFRTWSAGVDAIFEASAKETGGSRHVRFVTTPDCRVDVREVEVPAAAIGTFNATITALKALGYNRTDRKYLMFADSTVYCGIGTFAGDTRRGLVNRSNGGPGYARADSRCWTAGVAAHELGHNLGAVNNNSPNSSKAGHCLDEFDVMCYSDSGGLLTRNVCGERAHDQRFDCNHDDYFHTNPRPGSYLATNWNMADSEFLLRDGGGSGPPSSPSPSPVRPSSSGPSSGSASPSPSSATSSSSSSQGSSSQGSSSQGSSSRGTSPSRSTSATSSSSAGPGAGRVELRTADVTANSVRLSWDAGPAGSRYTVLLDGRALGSLTATGARVTGLRPDTTYTFQITLATGAAWTRPTTVRTTGAATAPTGAWRGLTNALTGEAADLYAASAADNTPVILYPRHGAANQLWRLDPVAGTGRVLLRSKATDRCVTPLGAGTAGSPLVQVGCDRAASWQPVATPYGTALTAPNGLVIGVGEARYGGHRLLTVQPRSDARHQSWAVS